MRLSDSIAQNWKGIRMIFAFLAGILSCTAIAGDGEVRLSGRIFDDVGNPVFGARISSALVSGKAFTDPQGAWSLEGRNDSLLLDGGVTDTLRIVWRDSLRGVFPIRTHVQSNAVFILDGVHLGDAPVATDVTGPAPPVHLVVVPPQPKSFGDPNEPLQTDGFFGPICIPVEKGEETIRSFRNAAKRARAIDETFAKIGLTMLGTGATLALVGWIGDSEKLIWVGGGTAGVGLIFMMGAGDSQARREMDRAADDLQRQLDERQRRRSSDVELRFRLDPGFRPQIALSTGF